MAPQPRLTGVPTGSSIQGSPGATSRQCSSQPARSSSFHSSYQRSTMPRSSSGSRTVSLLRRVGSDDGCGLQQQLTKVVGRDSALLVDREASDLGQEGPGFPDPFRMGPVGT